MCTSNVTYPDFWKDQLIYIIFFDQEPNVTYVWHFQGFLSNEILLIYCLTSVFLVLFQLKRGSNLHSSGSLLFPYLYFFSGTRTLLF